MAVEVRVQVTDPPSCVDKLTTHLDRAFHRISQDAMRQSQSQEHLLTRLTSQQDRLLNALHSISTLKPPAPDLSGLLKMLDRHWEGMLRALKTVKPSLPQMAPMLPEVTERFDRLEEAMGRSSTMTASPSLLHRFDAMTEAIRKMRPKTYGIMRG